jgi:hypothetical protein
MNKKTKKLSLIIFLFLVFGGVFYVSFFTSNETVEPKKEEVSTAEQPITTLQEPWKKELEAIKELQKTQPKAAKNKLEKLLDQLPQKLQRYYKVGFQSGIDDIHFYGQLIDQHGEPVSGATVSVDVGGRYLSGGSGQGVLRSDSDGRFYVRGTGGSLYIGPIKHPTLDTYRQLSPSGKMEGGADFTSYQHIENGNNLLWTNYSDPSTPYIFKVWRKTSGNIAKKLHQVSSTLIGFNCSGEDYTFDLTKRKWKERVTKGKSDGQFRIRYSCKESDEHRYFDDWAVEIEAIGGGIQETQDLYLNAAPEDGYESSYRLSMTKGESTYQKRMKKRFYFTAKNNQYYGSLEIDFVPYLYDGPRLFVTYKMNPTGEPYLVSAKTP